MVTLVDELPLTEGEGQAPPVPMRSRGQQRIDAAADVAQWVRTDVLAPCYREVIPSRSVWEWADDHNVYLDTRSTAKPCWYRSSKTPWAREVMETFTDPRWREDHAMKSSRVGMTEAVLNVLRFMPEHMPGQALYAINSTKEAKNIAGDRLIPTLRNSAAAALTDDDDDVTKQLIRLRSMTIHISGSYSAGTFRNKYLKFAALDECEVVDEVLEEGSLHDMARSRQSDVPDAKLYSLSKPVRWGSQHHREVVTGTLSAYLVECPHCGTFQELSFDGESPTGQLRIEGISPPLRDPSGNSLACQRVGRLRFDHCKDLSGEWDLERVEKETFYECINGCHITQEQKHGMIESGRGRWLATNPRPVPKKRSRHISDLYSLHDDVSWGRLACLYIQALADPGKLQHFINNHLGLPFREKASEVSEELVLECRSPYQRGTTPWRPDIVLIGGDTQDAYWKLVVAAFRLTGECAVVNWMYATTPAEILGLLDIPIPTGDGTEEVMPTLGFIDAGGHRTDEVYDLFLADSRLLPCFGRPQPNLKTTVWKGTVMHRMRPMNFYNVADALLKRRIYQGQIGKVREIKAALREHAAGRGPSLATLGLPHRLHLPADPFDSQAREFIGELQGETLTDTGLWEKVKGKRNDFGDALKYANAAFDYIRPILEAEARQRAAAAATDKPPAPPA
jgi:phage terminase large subunit GpA-like protein